MLHNLSIKKIHSLLSSEQRLKLAGVCCLLLFNSVLDLLGIGIIIPILTLLMEDNVVEKYEWAAGLIRLLKLKDENSLVILIAVAIFVFIAVKNLVSLMIANVTSRFAFNLSKTFALKLHEHYYRRGFSFFKSENSNVVLRNLRNATYQFSELQVLGWLNLLNELLVLSLITIGIALYNPQVFFLLMITVAPPFLIFYRWVKRKSIDLGNKRDYLEPKVYQNILESLSGFTDIKITGSEKFFRKKIENNLEEITEIDSKATVYNLAPTKVIETSLMLTFGVLICIGITIFSDKAELLKILGIFALAGYRIMPSLNRIMIAVNGINRSLWIYPLLEPLKSSSSEVKKIISGHVPLSFTSSISLKNVSYKYPGCEEPVISNLSLEIKKGEIIGITGPSGAGKTTLMNLLLGFLVPYSGKLLLDNVEIDQTNITSFHKNVGYVQQQVFLLNGTLAENIAFGLPKSSIDYEKITKVLKKASLYEVVIKLPKGVHEDIGESGVKLSGGQRQRLGIARALYFDSEILFFDEATSSLDNETEQEINSSIVNLQEDSITIIIIAHRKSTLESCQRIININPGGENSVKSDLLISSQL